MVLSHVARETASEVQNERWASMAKDLHCATENLWNHASLVKGVS